MSEENLKACDHCGNDAMLGKGHLGYYVVCRCISPKKTREEIIKAWNTRQSPESKKIEEALEGAESLINSLGVHHEYLTTQFLNSGEYDSRLPKKGMSEERFMKIDAMIKMYIAKSLYIKSILEGGE